MRSSSAMVSRAFIESLTQSEPKPPRLWLRRCRVNLIGYCTTFRVGAFNGCRVGGAHNFRNLPWHEARSTFELGLYFLAVVAVLGCLIRLGTIRGIIRDKLGSAHLSRASGEKKPRLGLLRRGFKLAEPFSSSLLRGVLVRLVVSAGNGSSISS
jgi:hypothetical protein